MLPISKIQAGAACRWLKGCWGAELRAAAFGPFTVDHLCAIACQETAYFWLPLINKLTPAEILARCVLDASGDYPGTVRSAFPKNTTVFRAQFGEDFASILIGEANKTRALRGMGPKPWIYKGYGIFQYDLQFVMEDESFFRLRQWHDFRQSLARCIKELRRTYAAHGDVSEAIRAYNGSGPAARQYRDNVLVYAAISAGV